MDNAPLSKDEDFLRKWFKIKQGETLNEKKNQLSISGEVRTLFRGSSARRQNLSTGESWRQYGEPTGFPNNNWINRTVLYFDYSSYLAWAHAKLKFENEMGALGGASNHITLEEGYLGYRILEDGKSIFDIFGGRTKLYTIFDSDVQFNAILDGLIFRYENDYSGWVHLDCVWAGGVITAFTDHYGWVAQLSLTDLFSTGLYTRFSFTDWQKKSPTVVYRGDGDPDISGSGGIVTVNNNPQFAFQISQFILGYEGTKHVKFPFKVYGALSFNHAARRKPALGLMRRNNIAWYAAALFGNVTKKGDMAFSLSYQYVGPQAVPEWDMSGIGLGNPSGSTFYYPALTSDPAPFGNTNFRGIEADYMVGLSENLAFLMRYQLSRSAVAVGHWKSYFQHLEASVVYAF